MGYRINVGLWLSAIVASGIGLAIAFTPVERGDSYCGTALYDTSTFGSCGPAVAWRRIAALLCLLFVSAIIIRMALSCDKSRRRTRIAASLLVMLSICATLVTINRLLQPTRAEWCGSVLNRHHTYEDVIEQRCDHLLAPYRNAAIAAGTISVVAFLLGIRLWRLNPRLKRVDACG